MTTVRAAVSPGTMLEIDTRDAAALLSFDIVSVADPNWLPGFVVVAVKLALERSEVTVRPISTSAERAMPARRVVDLRICRSFRLSASPVHVAGGRYEGNYRAGAILGHRRQGGDRIPRWYEIALMSAGRWATRSGGPGATARAPARPLSRGHRPSRRTTPPSPCHPDPAARSSG